MIEICNNKLLRIKIGDLGTLSLVALLTILLKMLGIALIKLFLDF